MEIFGVSKLDQEAGLRLVGELDVSTVGEFEEALASLEGRGQVKVDLSELTFIDSSGLHAIVAFAGTANGDGPVIVQGVSERMRRVFEITNVAQHPNLEIRVGAGGR